jgi:hypothetical protein
MSVTLPACQQFQLSQQPECWRSCTVAMSSGLLNANTYNSHLQQTSWTGQHAWTVGLSSAHLGFIDPIETVLHHL